MVGDDQHLDLDETAWVDARQLEKSANQRVRADSQFAMDLYRGPFLDGLALEIINARANLGVAAQGKGSADGAVMLLESACESAARLEDRHLQIKIDLELAEVYLQRGERKAAREALRRAETRLQECPRRLLEEWAQRLRKRL